MERYTAFTKSKKQGALLSGLAFTLQQQAVEIDVTERSLIESDWDFFRQAQLIGANYSPGLKDVWMGWPHNIQKLRHLNFCPIGNPA